MALVELGERTAVIPGGVNVGVIRAPDGVVLVDTGLNAANAKKTLKIVREEIGQDVVAILTTHAHADHFGGNATVVKRTGARVYAPAFDEAILRYPMLQPVLLFGGAEPLDSLRTGFLLADPSPVDEIMRPGQLAVAGLDVEIVPLPGHSPNQIGVLLDGVFFCADVVLPESVLAKYRIPYLYSLTDHLRSLAHARMVECDSAISGHGPILQPRTALQALIDANQALIDRVLLRTVELAGGGRTTEEILTGLLTSFEAPVGDAPAFYLLQPTVFAFLAHLQREGALGHEIKDGRAVWAAL